MQNAALGEDSAPELILRGGRFHTLDRSQPLAQAVAIRDGRFQRVGSDTEVLALAGPDGHDQARANPVAYLQHEAGAPPPESFDIDDAIESALEVGDRPPPPYGLEDLGRLLDHAKLLPPGCEAQRGTGKDVSGFSPQRNRWR